jgi:hypothetical protein
LGTHLLLLGTHLLLLGTHLLLLGTHLILSKQSGLKPRLLRRKVFVTRYKSL